MIRKLAAELGSARSVLILTHLRPDGDALGSSFGLRKYLRDNGAAAEVLLPAPPPERYRELCRGALDVVAQKDLDAYDCIVTLDCANAERLGCGAALTPELLKTRHCVNIDHHRSNSLAASLGLDGEGALSFVDGGAPSTCTLVAEILLAAGGEISPECATLLLAGMMTDTGCFCFANTNGRALRTAAEMADRGADVETISNALFFNKPLRQLQLESELVRDWLRIDCEGRFAYMFVPEELMRKYDFDLKEDEGLIDIVRSVRGAKIAMLCHRRPDGFRVSLRAKDRRWPVGPIARKFGGGGHDMAAGCTLDVADFAAVEAIILHEVAAALDQK